MFPLIFRVHKYYMCEFVSHTVRGTHSTCNERTRSLYAYDLQALSYSKRMHATASTLVWFRLQTQWAAKKRTSMNARKNTHGLESFFVRYIFRLFLHGACILQIRLVRTGGDVDVGQGCRQSSTSFVDSVSNFLHACAARATRRVTCVCMHEHQHRHQTANEVHDDDARCRCRGPYDAIRTNTCVIVYDMHYNKLCIITREREIVFPYFEYTKYVR